MRFRLVGATVAGMGLCLSGGGAIAETDSDTLERVLDTLNSGDFQTRDRGTEALADMFIGEVDQLIALLTDLELSEEQRARITVVAKDIFRTTPRGAIGIEMGEWTGRGLRVSKTRDGFPVHQLEQLLAGDVILEIGGAVLTTRQPVAGTRLRSEVISREPGEKVGVVILRPSAEDVQKGITTEAQLKDPVEIETVITLGDWAHLGNQDVQTAMLSGPLLDAAWALKLERAGVPLRRELRVLRSHTALKVWAKGKEPFELPEAEQFVAASIPPTALRMSVNTMRSIRNQKGEVVVTREDGKAVDTRVNEGIPELALGVAVGTEGRGGGPDPVAEDRDHPAAGTRACAPA